MLSRIRSVGLTARIIVVTMLLLGVVVGVNYVVVVRSYRASAEQAMVQKAAAFTAVADAAKNHVAKLNNVGVFATDDLMADVEQVVDAGKGYEEAKIFGTIPVVAGWSAAEEAAGREGIDFYLAAFDARNKTNEPKAGSFEEAMLTDLTTFAKAGESDVVSRIDRSTNQLHYMRAIRLGAECMMCHGVPGNEFDTDGDGLDPLGFEMESWKVGDMHGAYHVVMPLDPVDAQVAQFIGTGAMWSLTFAGGGVFAFVVLLRRIFANPIRRLIDRIKDIAEGEGDLTQRVQVDSDDEIGQLGRWFNRFVQRIHDTVHEVGQSAIEVAGAATQIAATSEQMAGGLDDQAKQVTQISSAIEQMSASVTEVAQRSISAADSARRSGETAESGGSVVRDTVTGMHSINESVSLVAGAVGQLGDRAQQIGAIVKVINEIADQTNLLALNAAIEAARAGEHGRGFAVVADEVRKLADRTTKATEEIAESVTAIQTETGAAVVQMDNGAERVRSGVAHATEAGDSLDQIVAGAREVAAMIESIAAASEQQSAASKEVASRIESVSNVTRQTTEGASQAAAAAQQLSSRAEQLRVLVEQFKTSSTAKQSF